LILNPLTAVVQVHRQAWLVIGCVWEHNRLTVVSGDLWLLVPSGIFHCRAIRADQCTPEGAL
jgi:uncharacterized protein YjlB